MAGTLASRAMLARECPASVFRYSLAVTPVVSIVSVATGADPILPGVAAIFCFLAMGSNVARASLDRQALTEIRRRSTVDDCCCESFVGEIQVPTVTELTAMEAGMIEAIRFRAREIKRPRIARGGVSPREGATLERHAATCDGCEVCQPIRTEDREPERAISEARAQRIRVWKRAARESTTGSR